MCALSTNTMRRNGARRLVIATAVALLCLAFTASAYANFGPHTPDNDLTGDTCATCHRIHSSFSSATFIGGNGGEYSGLLVGSAGTVTEFCVTCHGPDAPGAATNVVDGVYESSSSEYTSSTPGAPLNAGGFGKTPDAYAWNESAVVNPVDSTSRHDLDTGPLPLWSAASELPTMESMSCTSCHDPHPTSNYRMLKGRVNGKTVGGYLGASNDQPNAFVFSTETGFPTPGSDPGNPDGGFLKGSQGASQVADYRPNYTDGTSLLNVTAESANKSISSWCASCHAGYRQTSPDTTVSANFGIYEANPITGGQVGGLDRHFHPVDVTLENGFGADRTLPATVTPDGDWVPLESANADGSGPFYKDYMGCLTCHKAHGSSTVMSGWAASHLETDTVGSWVPMQDTTPGVAPDKQVAGGSPTVGSSALLRTNNRGVCERCHGGN